MNGNEKSEFSSQAPHDPQSEHNSYNLPTNGRPQQHAVPRYPFKRRSFSNENISVNVDANMNGNSNGTSDNWRFSRKRHSFQNLSTLQSVGNGEGCSSNNGTATTTAPAPAAPSTKIIRGNGSSSLGLRRRYSFESFELKKDSSSGSGSGSWPGGRRGPVFSHHHHQYSSLPLLTKRLSCRVLPTSTTLEPIPPSPTAPEDADENEESNQDNICGNLNGNNEETNAYNNSPQDEGHKKLPSEKSAEDEKSNSAKIFDTSVVAEEGVSTDADAVVTLDKIISSQGEALNFLIDELFYEPVLLFNYFRRGCGWLVDTTQLWCKTYNRNGDNGNTEGNAVSKSLINPNDETRPQASISKISPFPSLLQSLSTFSSSAAKTASPLFNTFCKALHNIRSSAPWTMDYLQHYYNHERLFNKIFSKSWRRRKDGWDVDRKDDGNDNECVEECANDDEQERKKKDGEDQMTNYASDDDVDKNAENDKKVSVAQRQSRGNNCTSGGGSTLTSKLSFVRKKLLRSFPFPDGKGNLLIVFSVVTVMTLLLLMLTMMTIFNSSASTSTGHILSLSSSKILEKSFSGGEGFGKLEGTNLAMMTDIIRKPNKQTIDTTRIYRDGCTINSKSEKYFHHVYSFTSSSKAPQPPSSSYSSMSPTSTCLYLLEHKKSGKTDECKAEKKEDAMENIFSQHTSSSLCLHCIANEKCASSGGMDDDDVGSVDIKKKKSTVDEPQEEEKEEEEKNEEKKRQAEFVGMEEAHYHHHNHQKQKQQKRIQEEQHQGRNKIVLKEPTLVPLAQLESDSQEQAVWVVLSVLFTIASSSCALTLFLVFIHKSYTPRNGIGRSSSACVTNSNAHHGNQCRCNSQHLIPSAFVQSSTQSSSTWLPEQHNQHSCCERPLKAVPTNSVCKSILVGGRDYHNASGIDQGYHNAPPPLRPTWSDPRRVKVTRPSNTRSGSSGSATGKRVNLAGRQLLQQPTTEKPIQREQDQYCRHHHHCRCQEKEEESQKKTFSSFPLFPRESAGIVVEVNAGPFQDKKGKCNFVSETEAVSSCCDGSRINSFSTCFSRCHCYYCCCCSASSSYSNDNSSRHTTENSSDKTCGNGNNIHDNVDYDDVRQKSERGELPKNNIANGDHDLYEDYDKWKSASSVGGDSTSVATGYYYEASNSRTKTSNGGGSGLLAIASENISSKKQIPCRSCYLCEDTGTVHGSSDILDNVNDKNGKDGRDDEQQKHEQWQHTHEEQRPRQHYYNSHHYHQVDSAVTLVDRKKDSSSSSVNCTSPYYYYRYYSPHQQHNQQQEQQCNNNQPHQNKYFLNKFCQPDKVLFPIFWTALVVDFNFPNCSPFLHALVVVVAIKLINLYHHYRYFTRLWGGLHQCEETAAAGTSNEKRDKEKCEFFNGKHYRDNHHHHQQNLFGDSTHDNRKEKRTKEGEEKEKREKVESKSGSEAAVTSWACSQYHHHQHHQQHPHKLPISSTCSQFFLSEKGEGYRSGSKSSSFQPLKGTPVTSRNSLKEQLREGFVKEASSQSEQQCLHFLLLFNPQKNNLLRGSSKITILLWLYFILIRRLGSFLAFSTACITTITTTYTTHLYFPLSSQFSFCFTHFLGIIGLLFGQLCIQRLGCHQWNNWICQLTCCFNGDTKKSNSGDNKDVQHKGYSRNCQYCCTTSCCCFRGNSSETTPFPPSTPSAASYACPTDYSYSTRHDVKISDKSNKGEEKYPCNRNSSSSPCVVIPPCSSSSKVHHQEYHSSHHFNLDENFISQRVRVQSETSSSSRENKERRTVSSTTSSSSLSSSSSVAALLEDEQNEGVKDEQCACSSAFSSESRNNKGNVKSRNDFEYNRLERNDDNDNLNNKKQECCWCYCCNSCSSSRCTVNNTGIIIGESNSAPSEPFRKGAKENYTFHDRTRRDGREVYYSTTPPTSLSVPSTTCFCINSNHHHQSKNENCLPLHPSRNSGDLSSSSKVKSSKRIAFLLHNDNQKDASGTGSSSYVAGKTNNKRSSLRQNNLWNGNNGSNGCSLIGSIGGNSGRRKKYLQTARQEEEEKTKEANKSCNKNCGLLSLPLSSLLRADVINYPTNSKITKGADCCAAASSSPRKSKEKVGEVVGGLVPETIPFSDSFRRKINGISGRTSSYSINSKSSSDEDDDDSDSTQLGSLSRSSSSSGSLVLGADELPEDSRNKVENILTTSTRQTRERIETNDDNNNSNHNHNSNDDNDHVGNSRSSTDETTSVSRGEKTEERKGNREVIFVSSSTSTSASSTSSSSSSPNPTTSAELESSSNTTNNPVKAGGVGEEGAVIFQKDNCQSRNVTTVDDEEDLSYFLYYNHVNNNNSGRRTDSGGGGLSSVASRANDAGSSGIDTISMRTGGLVFRPSSCLKSEKSISFRDEDCKQSTSSGDVNLRQHKSVPSFTSPLQGILSKTNHMNCKGVSKKSTGSSGSSSSSSGKIIKNVGISSATATIITGGETGRKGSIGGGGAAINRVPTPPPSLTSPHTSILAGLGGSGGGRERKTYISHKFITTSGITGGAGGSSSSRNITGDGSSGSSQVIGINDDGGGISPVDNAAIEISSQSDASSSHNTSTATITILPNYPNDSTSCTSTTSLTTSPPSSSSVSALTGTTVIIDGGDNQIKGSDDGDNSKSINTESQQPSSPPSSSLQVSQSPSSLPTSTSTSSSQQQSSNANAASFLFSSSGTTTKRLFRSGSQCCVNSSTSSSPILHFQQSSTPPQQLLNNNHHNSPQQQHMNNQQGSIEKYLSTKMRRTSLPAALPAQRTAIHHKQFLTGTGGSTLNDGFQRSIQKILSDDLAVKFSLKGKRGKKSLQDFPNLLMALKECVRSYPSLSTLALSGQLDDKSCEDAISRALKKSADRVFQRNKKAGEHAERMDVD